MWRLQASPCDSARTPAECIPNLPLFLTNKVDVSGRSTALIPHAQRKVDTIQLRTFEVFEISVLLFFFFFYVCSSVPCDYEEHNI